MPAADRKRGWCSNCRVEAHARCLTAACACCGPKVAAKEAKVRVVPDVQVVPPPPAPQVPACAVLGDAETRVLLAAVVARRRLGRYPTHLEVEHFAERPVALELERLKRLALVAEVPGDAA